VAAASFFTVSDSGYFLGLVGLVNSLRLVGHREPIIVADTGLDPEQRALLHGHVELHQLPRDAVANPTQYKAFAHLRSPSGVVVIIDSDIIVTANLTRIIQRAADGAICLYPDPDWDRWFAEWQQVFELPQPPRQQVYGCAGFVALSTSHWPELLRQWWDACARIGQQPTYQEGTHVGPTAQADQDALNALLMSEYHAGAAHMLPEREQVFRWDFPAVRVLDARTLRCEHRGTSPTLLHGCMVPKPWQTRGVRRNAYVTLLRRLLTGADVAVKVPETMLPLWARRGPAAEMAVSVWSTANMFNRDDGVVPKAAYAVARRVKRRLVAARAN
jgi:hypothetical protein